LERCKQSSLCRFLARPLVGGDFQPRIGFALFAGNFFYLILDADVLLADGINARQVAETLQGAVDEALVIDKDAIRIERLALFPSQALISGDGFRYRRLARSVVAEEEINQRRRDRHIMECRLV
jgi:hypothetical protein